MSPTRSAPPPELFDGTRVSEVVVPVRADGHYERGMSLATGFARSWGTPLRFVHVGSAGDLDAASTRFTAAHPDIATSTLRVEASDVAGGVASALRPSSLLLVSSDHIEAWGDGRSTIDRMLDAVTGPVLLCGPMCANPDLDGSIIVPVDGSPLAEAALEPAKALASAHGSRIWVVSVVSASTVAHTERLRAEGHDVSESAYVRSIVDRLSADGYHARWEMLHGSDVARSLARFAREQEAALVVAASHGAASLHRLLFGSTTLGLVAQVEVPVLITASVPAPHEAVLEQPSSE